MTFKVVIYEFTILIRMMWCHLEIMHYNIYSTINPSRASFGLGNRVDSIFREEYQICCDISSFKHSSCC